MEEIIEAYLRGKDVSNIKPNDNYEKTLLNLIATVKAAG